MHFHNRHYDTDRSSNKLHNPQLEFPLRWRQYISRVLLNSDYPGESIQSGLLLSILRWMIAFVLSLFLFLLLSRCLKIIAKLNRESFRII